jgi:hypothetical protein
MRMRGLEPPPSYLDTDLNRGRPEEMGPRASGMSQFAHPACCADASDRATVATTVATGRSRPPRRRVGLEGRHVAVLFAFHPERRLLERDRLDLALQRGTCFNSTPEPAGGGRGQAVTSGPTTGPVPVVASVLRCACAHSRTSLWAARSRRPRRRETLDALLLPIDCARQTR